MAENRPATTVSAEDTESLASIALAQDRLRQTLASGLLPLEQEIMIRSRMADLLVQIFERSGQYQYIDDAVQHIETILRRLPRDSPARPKYLSTLSFIRMTEYLATNSRHALDEAVLNGRRAKEMAITIDLLRHDPDVYFRILANFGYALAQRYALLQNIEDLEGAIDCAREAYKHAPKDSEQYYLTLNNLASRLCMRYNKSQDADDINEALRLINELRSRTVPGTPEHAMAVVQLGRVISDKFSRTNHLQDLDEALGYCKSGLDSLPEDHETRLPLLKQIIELYDARHQKTSEEADLRNLVSYSGTLFHNSPSGHAARGQYLLNYIRRLYKLATTSQTLRDIQSAIQTIRPILENISTKFPEQTRCWAILADLSLDQYNLSHDLQDLVACVNLIERITNDYNNEVDRGDSSKGLLETSWLWDLTKSLRLFAKAPASNYMRKLAEKELPEVLRTCRKTQNYAGSALEQLHHQIGVRLEVLANAIAAGQTLSDDEIAITVTKLQDKKANATRERQERRRLKTNDYETEFDVRKLAVDESGNMIFDLSGLVSDILGWDANKTYSKEEFIALETQQEQKALDKAKLEGRHPNRSLCRMCRDLAKVLHPTADGFELTAKDAWFPFGNYFQLSVRSACAICSLMLSIITTKSGALHPRLAAVDPEVQGVRLSTGRLSTNERLMRFDYGMKHVGELRVLTPQNYSQALRQAWETDSQSTISSILDDRNSPIYKAHQQRINSDLVKSWLNNCDHNHGSACNHPRSGKRAENGIHLTLIDVKEECLIPASSDAKYFALSYVWGRVEMHKTLRSNYEARNQPGALAAIQFPKTIRNAMEFVQSLGERYLWIDAICLVQDDEDEMTRQVLNMDIIYGQAFATIVALEGTDANAGLAGVRAGTRKPQKITTLSISNKSVDLDDDPDSKDKETIHLVATPRPLYLALEISQWNSRGWIVQEHLLSRRCLYFASDAVYFQCGQETISEGGANEAFDAFLFDKTALSDNQILEKANRNNPLLGLDVFYNLTLHERIADAFIAYTKLVETYSQRNLTFKSDILKAFAGMFAVLEEHFQGTVVHGLPAAVISHALLWSPGARLPRRNTSSSTNLSLPTDHPDPLFPSWSWVGWDGPVEYRLFEHAKGKIILPTTRVKVYIMIDGPVSDVIQGDEETSEPIYQAHDKAGEKVGIPSRENGPGIISSENSDQEKNPEKQILAKIIPDQVRGSTWVITGPQAPLKRKDPHLDTKQLRFTARTVPLPAFQISPHKEYLSSRSQVHIRTSQAVRRILDRNGKHCGLWWEQAGYGYIGLGISPEAESKIDMLEISRYGDAYRPRDGPFLVEGPISIFDDEVFPAVGPGSGLVNVLVVDLDMGLPDGIGERCTVAVVHSKAWEAANPREKEVRIV
ncbi:Nn.00g104620.m01.CDS01 [Neocucurbitaria sp. VM-36]